MAFITKQKLVSLVVCALLLVAFIAPGCKVDSEKKSDPKAVELANAVIDASGGLENWQNTRYVSWRHHTKRLHVWDKLTGDIRVETRGTIVLMNLNTKKGRVWKDEEELTNPDDLQRGLDYGYQCWVNDSYWMFLPFKLLDKGVTLKYLGEGETQDSVKADIISLTFSNVGLTPENKYHVYIDKESKRLISWDHYMDANDEWPRFTTVWADYQKYGNIWLSSSRGKKRHSDLGVFEKMPGFVFQDPEPFEWAVIDSLNATQVQPAAYDAEK